MFKNNYFYIKYGQLKKGVLIALLSLFVFANTELGQLIRVPVLIHHYFEHLEENPKESIFEFISEHYQAHILHPDDKHGDHQRLPFKTTHLTVLNIPLITESESIYFVLHDSITIPEKKQFFKTIDTYRFETKSGVWQPPQYI